MNEPIRADKEDRYLSENSKTPPLPPKSKAPLSIKKWVILVLALLIIILLLSFTIFKSRSLAPENESDQPNDPTQTNRQDPPVTDYQTLTPPAISRDATESKQDSGSTKERLEISGEVTDLLTQKIAEINANTSEEKKENIALASQNVGTDLKFNELPLQSTIEDSHYTIQLLASSSLENIMAFAKLHKISNYQIYETHRDNKTWFILIKGNYPTIDDAKRSIQDLPQILQKNNPWIKSGVKVNKEKKST